MKYKALEKKSQPVYIVVGVPASGKSWICEQLDHLVTYLPHDDHKDNYLEAIEKALESSTKPLLTETPFSVSKFTDKMRVIPVFIVDDPALISKRYKDREGRDIPKGHLTRQDTYRKRAKELGAFSGTSEQVLNHLKLLLGQ